MEQISWEMIDNLFNEKINEVNYNNGIQLNQINGPESDLPVTFIFSALKPVVLTGTITGNVRMFFAGDFQFGMGKYDRTHIAPIGNQA